MIRDVGYLTFELFSQKNKRFEFLQFLDMYIKQMSACQIGKLNQFISKTFKKIWGVCGNAMLALNH